MNNDAELNLLTLSEAVTELFNGKRSYQSVAYAARKNQIPGQIRIGHKVLIDKITFMKSIQSQLPSAFGQEENKENLGIRKIE